MGRPGSVACPAESLMIETGEERWKPRNESGNVIYVRYRICNGHRESTARGMERAGASIVPPHAWIRTQYSQIGPPFPCRVRTGRSLITLGCAGRSRGGQGSSRDAGCMMI